MSDVERAASTDMPRDASPTKRCRWCAAEIPAEAVLCRECKNHQSVWREFSLYVASLAGMLTLVGSGLTFIGTNWDTISRQFFSKRSVSLEYLGVLPGRLTNIVVANDSVKPVFVASVSIADAGASDSAVFNKTVSPSEFSTLKEDAAPESWPYKGFVGTPDGRVPELVATGTDLDARAGKGCFVPYYYSANADDLRRIDRLYAAKGSRLVTRPVDIEVVFIETIGADPKHQTFPGVATFLQREAGACKADLVPG